MVSLTTSSSATPPGFEGGKLLALMDARIAAGLNGGNAARDIEYTGVPLQRESCLHGCCEPSCSCPPGGDRHLAGRLLHITDPVRPPSSAAPTLRLAPEPPRPQYVSCSKEVRQITYGSGRLRASWKNGDIAPPFKLSLFVGSVCIMYTAALNWGMTRSWWKQFAEQRLNGLCPASRTLPTAPHQLLR